jgi:hypothetical protein
VIFIYFSQASGKVRTAALIAPAFVSLTIEQGERAKSNTMAIPGSFLKHDHHVSVPSRCYCSSVSGHIQLSFSQT